MTLSQMRYVLAVAKTGSFRSAASSLFVSEANISKQIKALENELGIFIFNRQSNCSILTGDGQKIIPYFNELLANAAFIEENFSSKYKVDLKFSVSSQHYTFVAIAFSKLVNQFTKDKYHFSLYYEQTIDILRSVQSNRSELGVIIVNCEKIHNFERLFKGYGLKFYSLFQKKVRVFLSSKHPLAEKKTLMVKDLEPYPCIVYAQDEETPNSMMEEVMYFKKFPSKVLFINDLNVSFELILNSLAYDIGTGLLTDDMLGMVNSVVLEDGPDIQIGYLIKEGKKLSPFGKEYIELLETTIEQMRKNSEL